MEATEVMVVMEAMEEEVALEDILLSIIHTVAVSAVITAAVTVVVMEAVMALATAVTAVLKDTAVVNCRIPQT